MGKIGGSSWLEAVKRAFRSPTKLGDEERSSSSSSSRRRREKNEQEEDHKKREKRRWRFLKPSPYERTIQHKEATNKAKTPSSTKSWTLQNKLSVPEAAGAEERRAVAMAMATTAVAKAAVATAQAAAEVLRLARPSTIMREHDAAIAIQTAFRGYLARRALKALKGVVALQAFVRGYNVRKRAKMTLQCMQSLLRVQTKVCHERKRLSYEGTIDSKYFSALKHLQLYQLADRMFTSRNSTSSVATSAGDREDCSRTWKEAGVKREKSLSYAFSQQMWKSGNAQTRESKQHEENRRERIKTVEIDTSSRHYSHPSPNFYRTPIQDHHYKEEPRYSDSSPLYRTDQNMLINSLTSPSPSRIRTFRAYSETPIEENNYRKAQTPTLRSPASPLPNYMAATASAMARLRSQSAPRQRPVAPERESLCSARKRLSFAVPDS